MAYPINRDRLGSYINLRVIWRTPRARRINAVQWSNYREGILLALIPAGTRPVDAWPELADIRPSQQRLGGGITETTSQDRVLIQVDRFNAKWEPLLPHFFAPRVISLKQCLNPGPPF